VSVQRKRPRRRLVAAEAPVTFQLAPPTPAEPRRAPAAAPSTTAPPAVLEALEALWAAEIALRRHTTRTAEADRNDAEDALFRVIERELSRTR